jgi:hypothetical protein
MGKKDHGENFSIDGRTKDPHIFLLLVQRGVFGSAVKVLLREIFACDLFHPYDLSVKLTYVIYIKKLFCALVINYQVVLKNTFLPMEPSSSSLPSPSSSSQRSRRTQTLRAAVTVDSSSDNGGKQCLETI